MNDQEFYDIFNFYNQETLSNGRFVYLGYIDHPGQIMPQIHAVTEKRIDESLPQGEKELRIDINEDEATIRRTLHLIEENLEADNTILKASEFSIEARFLKYPEVLAFLNRCRENNHINSINIVGEDYTLDEETYNELREFSMINVSNSEINRDNINLTYPQFSIVSGINSSIQPEMDFVIKENMTDEQLLYLIFLANNVDTENKKIQIRFYNPINTIEVIERLERLGLNSDITIGILGYPLVENSEAYESLEEISRNRKIEVTYTCCHDLLEHYSNEPFLIENTYFSELEPDGKTDLATYVKILKFVENFQQSTANVDSTIEKTMMAYQYLNDNYYYDVDAGQTKNYGDTRDVDKILDTDEIVCAGYSNLLTIMCRRVGIPMFTYGAPGHRMNVARIVEKDENGEVVLDKICTFDSTNDSGYYIPDINSPTGQRRVEQKDSYTYFGVDPESWLHTEEASYMTLANGLAIPRDEFIENCVVSHSPFGAGYIGGYSAYSYMYSMLHLMGYNYNPREVDMFDLVAQLNEEGRVGEIPHDLIYKAANNIAQRNTGSVLTPEARTRIDDSLAQRTEIFNEPNARLCLNRMPNLDVINIPTYKTNMPQHNYVDINAIDIGPIYYQDLDNLRTGEPVTSRTANPVEEPIVEPQQEEQPIFTEEDFSEDYIAGTTIRRPRERGIYETDEEYVEFLERYYNYYFRDAAVHSNTTYRLTRDQIIQDLPIYQTEEVPFTEEDYSDEYIPGTNIRRPRYRGIYETDEEYVEFLERFYNHHFPNRENYSTYSLTRDQIIQDPPIYQTEEVPFTEEDYSDEYIPGTNIRRPRHRGIYETDEEYVEFLERYYNYYFPNSRERNNSTYSLTRDQIIQDPPIYQTEEVPFTEEDYSDEYIPGTNIRRPRHRGIYETDEEYVEFLERYYNYYFPQEENTTHRTR